MPKNVLLGTFCCLEINLEIDLIITLQPKVYTHVINMINT
nr:MAG TPA: hypothetical protein [Bacteriophage sp.]